MAELNLDELERLAKAATPGPWAVDDESKHDSGRLYVAKGRTGKLLGRIAEVFENCLVRDMAEMEANAQFIATARNALPALIDRIRELEMENKLLAAVVDSAEREVDDLRATVRELEKDAARLDLDRKGAERWLLDLMGEWDFAIPTGAFDKIVAAMAASAKGGKE